jgi:hypothetical protein
MVAVMLALFLLYPALTIQAVAAHRTAPEQATDTIEFTAVERCGESFSAWPMIVRVVCPDSWNPEKAGDWTLIELDTDHIPRHRLPFQKLDAFDALGAPNKLAPVRAVDLCFPITLKAGETRSYRLLSKASPTNLPWTPNRPADLKIEGQGPGAQIDTGNTVFGFHPANGQFGWYLPKNAGITNHLGFRQGAEAACHHNPDVWCFPRAWGHTSDWRCQSTNGSAPAQIVQQGPLVYRFVRSGWMPNCDGIRVRVSYTVFAGLPIVMESSLMEFTQSLVVYAVRNNELVFNRGIHTHAAYPDATGRPISVRAFDPDHPTNFLGRLPIPDLDPDIPWVALYNETNQSGVAMLNLERWSFTGAPNRPLNMPAYYYFNDYGSHGTGARFDWNFLYFCRAEVFTISALPAGSQFGESSAIFILQDGTVRPDQLEQIESWRKRLEYPPLIKFTGEYLPL